MRRPWIAAILGLLLPGLGHLYVGRPGWAAVLNLLAFLGAVLLYAGARFQVPAPLNIVLPILLLVLLLIGGPTHAAFLARRSRRDSPLKPYNRWYVYAGLYLVLGVFAFPAATDLFRASFIEAFRTPSGSMEPTLWIGDFIYVLKWPDGEREPAPGRVVVFESVEEPGLKVIKRIMGMPGDTLLMRSGELFRNGSPMRETYVLQGDRKRSEDPVHRARMKEWQVSHLTNSGSDYSPDLQDWGPLVVPGDSFFVLGDNRDESYDSRYYGFIPYANIVGRPSVIYFSFEPGGPGPLLSRVRWARIGRKLG